MDSITFCRALGHVRSLPSAFIQYLITAAEKLPPQSRQRIVDSCRKADAKIAQALHACINRISPSKR
jgi:hypothetical protein